MTTAADRRAHKAAMTVRDDWREIITTLDHESGYMALDLETSGLSFNRDRIAVIALYGPDTNTAGIIHLRGAYPQPELMEWLGNPARKFITHNGTQFDIPYLQRYGLAYRQPTWFDTLIGEQTVLTSDRKDVKVNLKDTLKRRLSVEVPKDVDHATWMQPALDAQQMRYLADDIYYLPRLREAQLARAAEQDGKRPHPDLPCVSDAMAFEQRLAPIVSGMIMRGIPLDVGALIEYYERQTAETPELASWLKAELGIQNIGHSPSVVDAMARVYGVHLRDSRADTLKLLADSEGPAGECARKLLAYRHGAKRGSMYGQDFLQKYVHEGRVYGGFWQLGTNTGRFSSSNPNLQQLPRDMRHVFGDPTGTELVVAADYSAIEVRCAADLYRDTELLKALEAADIHRATASSIFGIPEEEVTKEQRRQAKAGNFNLLFGGGVATLYHKARADGSTVTKEEMQRFADRYLARFQGVAKAREKAYYLADLQRPTPIIFPTGLRRVLVPGKDLKGTTLLNNKVQGMAAAGLKHALLLMDECGISQYLSAVVHDEIVTTPPASIADEVGRELERCMLEGMAMVTDAPIAVDMKGGATWG